LPVELDRISHRLVKLALVSFHIGLGAGEHADNREGKLLSLLKTLVNITPSTIKSAHINPSLETAENTCNGRSSPKLSEDCVFADDRGQECLMHPHKLWEINEAEVRNIKYKYSVNSYLRFSEL